MAQPESETVQNSAMIASIEPSIFMIFPHFQSSFMMIVPTIPAAVPIAVPQIPF